jgi:hypothetical protein
LLLFPYWRADDLLLSLLLHVIFREGHYLLREEQLVKQGVLRLGLGEELVIDV